VWLHVPSTCCPCAPGSGGSTSGSPRASDSSDSEVVLFATSSGKPTPRPCSWRGWRTRPWVRLLSGTTLPRSTLVRGVESWISSLRASRALPSASLGAGGGATTTAGSGRSSSECCAMYDPASSSWKTCQASFLPDESSGRYSVDWPRSGTMRNGRVCPRLPLALRIDASGGSASRTTDEVDPSWPTPRTVTGGAESAERKQKLGRTDSGGGRPPSGGDIVADAGGARLPEPEPVAVPGSRGGV
jgi:hypothetical protein